MICFPFLHSQQLVESSGSTGDVSRGLTEEQKKLVLEELRTCKTADEVIISFHRQKLHKLVPDKSRLRTFIKNYQNQQPGGKNPTFHDIDKWAKDNVMPDELWDEFCQLYGRSENDDDKPHIEPATDHNDNLDIPFVLRHTVFEEDGKFQFIVVVSTFRLLCNSIRNQEQFAKVLCSDGTYKVQQGSIYSIYIDCLSIYVIKHMICYVPGYLARLPLAYCSFHRRGTKVSANGYGFHIS